MPIWASEKGGFELFFLALCKILKRQRDSGTNFLILLILFIAVRKLCYSSIITGGGYVDSLGKSTSMSVKAVSAVVTQATQICFQLYLIFKGKLTISKKIVSKWEKITGVTHEIEVGYCFSADARDLLRTSPTNSDSFSFSRTPLFLKLQHRKNK